VQPSTENVQLASPNKTSETLDSLVRKWLVVLGEAYQVVISSALASVWVTALEDLSRETLDAMFKKLLQTWRPDFGRKFPVPADIRALRDVANANLLRHEAEMAWREALLAICDQYHPDLGWRGPRLTERVSHAIEAANGVHYIWGCSEVDLVWAKKRFVERYEREGKLPGYTALCPSEEVRVLIEGFAHQMPGTTRSSDDKKTDATTKCEGQ
jgi:hypothetical protein